MAASRKKIDGVWHVHIRFTSSCSGCFEGGENMERASRYPYDEKARCHVGSGCKECGYTGKRRTDFWQTDYSAHPELLREEWGL